MNLRVIKVGIRFEHDIVLARQKARSIAGLLGFDSNDQTRISTAVSEIVRNAFTYSGGGEIEFLVKGLARPQTFMVKVMDRGHGIADVPAILAGRYVSTTGMGLGIAGAKRLMDHFEIETARDQGTTVSLGKIIPKDAPLATPQSLARIAGILGKQVPRDPFEEILQQNQELMHALAEIKQRKEEQENLNRELEDTNRGIMALYAELDEKATNLTKANELKVQFLSNMSHEFRTPLSSILSLTQILLARLDGDLTDEQERQVNFIKKGAEELLVMVNDLLDLAKIEAGKVVVHPSECQVPNIFSALRGMFKPMLLDSPLSLAIDDPEAMPAMITDEGKVSQILRNLVSNSIKFTEKGKIRVSAELGSDGKTVRFIVADTGTGIPPEYLEKIFEEFTQIDTRLHRAHKGTGLGLPLSRKLAELLGGTLTVESSVGSGSVFTATIPVRPQDGSAASATSDSAPRAAAFMAEPDDKKWLLSQLESLKPGLSSDAVLLIDNDEVSRYVLKGLLAETGYSILEADSGIRGMELARERHPGIIFLDLMMPGMNGFETLEKLRADPATCDIPVVIVSSKILDVEERRMLAGMTSAIFPKANSSREAAIESIRAAVLAITTRTS